MDVIPQTKPLIRLVEQAKDGEIVLPRFQRDFVWARDNIKDFLVSVLKGYFVGSFLFLRCNRENIPFAIKDIKGINKRPEELNPHYMILDGQQRLTSLLYVFSPLPLEDFRLKGTNHPYKFYLNLDGLTSNKVDDAVWSERSDLCKEYDTIEYQFKNNIIPFARMLDWDNWIKDYAANLETDRDKVKFYEETKDKWNEGIKNFKNTVVPIIEIPMVASDNVQGISEICSIFEKMNSTGIRLTVFDLLAARLYKSKNKKGDWIDLHGLWEESLREYPLLKEFSNGASDSYGVFALRVIALKRGLEAKGKSIITLDASEFEEDLE